MTPVILLTDGYLANAAEPWQIPNVEDFEPIESNDPPQRDPELDRQAQAFQRNPRTYGRPWIPPGTPDLMHRVGGIEKDVNTGHISYASNNHQAMTDMRAAKVASVSRFIPAQEMELGGTSGSLVVVGWGSTYGPIFQAVQSYRQEDKSVSYLHLTYISPLPDNLAKLLGGFDHILVPEMNMGQLSTLLCDKLGVTTIPYCKVEGQPFLISEIEDKISECLSANVVQQAPAVAQGEPR